MKQIPRVFKPWWDWECYKAGFYNTKPVLGKSSEDCKRMYCEFLSDITLFEYCMNEVAKQWENSCLHFLTNPNINRVAWLGQSAMCLATGVPSHFKSGFTLMSSENQKLANVTADKFLEGWIIENFEKCVGLQK